MARAGLFAVVLELPFSARIASTSLLEPLVSSLEVAFLCFEI